MGWLSVLGTIGGAVLAPFTGGASLAIGSAIGGAADAAMAENKAAKQEAGGSQAAAALYDPYVQRGNDAGNTLAGLMGLPMHGGTPSEAAPQIAGARSAAPSRIPPQPVVAPVAPPQTLSAMMARRQKPEAPISSYGAN
jgi:hypothetical protein